MLVMKAHKFKPRRLKSWPETFFAQPKLNGVRCWTKGGVPYSSQGNEFMSIPHIKELLLELPFDVDGELYIHGQPLEYISGLARRQHADEETLELEYWIFDVIPSHDPGVEFCRGKQKRHVQSTRILELVAAVEHEILPQKSILYVGATSITADRIDEWLQYLLADGFEGLILRNPDAFYEFRRSPNLLKLKPERQFICTVKSFKEEVSQERTPKGRLGAVLVSSGEVADTWVGTGAALTAEGRSYWWEHQDQLIGMPAACRCMNLTTNGVMFHPVLQKFLRSFKGD